MFFTEERNKFFRPLVGKYREQVVECLQALYGQLYSSMADYRQSLGREQLIDIFHQALVQAPVLEEEGEGDTASAARNEKEQAAWILTQLLESGWLEKLYDEATLQSTYAFSRVGRLFTQPMVETAGRHFRTRHRNTRNTRNALSSFLDKGEVYDLLDAFEYSERIISDFSDVISELDDRKRQLVKEVEAQQLVQRASDEFFDFMEKRFMPDLAIRLSADSVEKYRDEIQTLLKSARRKRKEFKADVERELRKIAPELLTDPKRSLYLMILDGIEKRMQSAAEVMLPALRHALNSFTRRADIIIRQLSYSGAVHNNRLLDVCQQLNELDEQEQSQRLEQAGESLAIINAAMLDPSSALRLNSERVRRIVNTSTEEQHDVDAQSRKQLFIQQAVEQAFAVNNQDMRDYLVEALSGGHVIRSQNLPVKDARELLMSAHAIELGSASDDSSEYMIRVDASGQRISSEYFNESDEFMIELVKQVSHVE